MTLQDVVNEMGLRVTSRDFAALDGPIRLVVTKAMYRCTVTTTYNFGDYLSCYDLDTDDIAGLKSILKDIFHQQDKVDHTSMLI